MAETKSDTPSHSGINVVYAEPRLIPSFHKALNSVASERVYLDMTEAAPLEAVTQFQTSLIDAGAAVYYAVQNEEVVGWCDIFPKSNPRQSHRGGLGMGIIASHRGQGLGRKLMDACLKKAKESGLEKVELYVYTSNKNAVALYEKVGFEREGLIKNYRKLDGVYFDCLAMGKFL
ncbi:MAG: GNAT family N-acetyltransferase [Bdellovibrionota bacterium]